MSKAAITRCIRYQKKPSSPFLLQFDKDKFFVQVGKDGLSSASSYLLKIIASYGGKEVDKSELTYGYKSTTSKEKVVFGFQDGFGVVGIPSTDKWSDKVTETITITVTHAKYGSAVASISIAPVFIGDRGPALRGPQLWDDCKLGYKFQAGAEGEEYKDLVVYKDKYYSCMKSHTKTASNYPNSGEDQTQHYWKVADSTELIASRIILAELQIVKNLAVNTVIISGGTGSLAMVDKDGNDLFRLHNGNITCNRGTFKSVEVDGDISARTLHLKLCTPSDGTKFEVVDGSLILDYGKYILPQLEKGETMSIRYIRRTRARGTSAPTIFKTSGNAIIWDNYTSENGKTQIELNYGMYEILGYGAGDITDWYVTQISK